MPALVIGLVLALAASLAPPLPATTVALDAPAMTTARPEEARLAADVPQRAQDVLALILERHGEPLPGHVGGRVFQNRERRLPRGTYREYDVNPKRPGRPRDAERIVIEQKTGRAYYSGDHYRTFVPMN